MARGRAKHVSLELVGPSDTGKRRRLQTNVVYLDIQTDLIDQINKVYTMILGTTIPQF